eukprot:TRINITY_DN4620_c0_g1_i1.p1 TRINITY_DN4620_c0_g1~~TRINITY_DN4620_c0_g1_i1.p1  ORF type:complete len:107 (-),score=13.37 TRINITY_DN4620_c0_g1_i1:404-724(-)
MKSRSYTAGSSGLRTALPRRVVFLVSICVILLLGWNFLVGPSSFYDQTTFVQVDEKLPLETKEVLFHEEKRDEELEDDDTSTKVNDVDLTNTNTPVHRAVLLTCSG